MAKKVLSAVLLGGAALISASGLAQDVQSQKTETSFKDVISPSAKVSSRYYLSQKENADDSYYTQFRTDLSADLFKDKVNLLLHSRFRDHYANAQSQGAFVNTVNYFYVTPKSFFSANGLDLGAYYQLTNPKGDDNTHTLAATVSYGKDFALTFGTLTTSLYGEFDVNSKLKKEEAPVKVAANDKDLALAHNLSVTEDGFSDRKTRPDLYSEFDQTIAFSPAALKALSFTFVNYIKSDYNEQIKMDSEGNKDSSYKQHNYTEQQFTTAYKINDRFTVANDIFVFHDGLFESNGDAAGNTLLTNIRLDAKLF
jgi:hypothetical protein